MYYWNIETLSTDHGCVFASGKQFLFLVHITVINFNMTHIFVRYQIIDFWFRGKILTTQLNISNVRFYFEMVLFCTFYKIIIKLLFSGDPQVTYDVCDVDERKSHPTAAQ